MLTHILGNNKFFPHTVVESSIGSLGNNDNDGCKNVQVQLRSFKLYRAYSISFSSLNVGNFFVSWILKDCIEDQEKKKKVVALCSRLP